jgi:hypothetical protein
MKGEVRMQMGILGWKRAMEKERLRMQKMSRLRMGGIRGTLSRDRIIL